MPGGWYAAQDADPADQPRLAISDLASRRCARVASRSAASPGCGAQPVHPGGTEPVAEARDALNSANAIYNLERKRLTEKMDLQLVDLKADTTEAYENFKTSSTSLRSSMEAANLNEVPMRDRPPVYIKVVKGGKKNITMKWLCSPEGLGSKDGKALWGKTPRHDDKRELVIPEAYDDQPSD